MELYSQAGEHAYDFSLQQTVQASSADDWANIEHQAVTAAFNCAGTCGTFGTAGGCIGSFGSFGCANCVKVR